MFLEVLVEGGADVPTIREIKKHQRRKAEILRPPKKVFQGYGNWSDPALDSRKN